MPSTDRVISRWRRETDLKNILHTQCLSLLFILINPGVLAKHDSNANAFPLSSPPNSGCTEICVFYSKTNLLEWKSQIWLTNNILGVWEMGSCDFVALRWSFADVSQEERSEVFDSVNETNHLMVVGEEYPEVWGAGIYDGLVSFATSQFGRLYCIFGFTNTIPGVRATWSTKVGHKYKE